jgi:hypothetical protein
VLPAQTSFEIAETLHNSHPNAYGAVFCSQGHEIGVVTKNKVCWVMKITFPTMPGKAHCSCSPIREDIFVKIPLNLCFFVIEHEVTICKDEALPK